MDSYRLLGAFCMTVDRFRFFLNDSPGGDASILLHWMLMSSEETVAEGHFVTLPAAHVDLACRCPWSWNAWDRGPGATLTHSYKLTNALSCLLASVLSSGTGSWQKRNMLTTGKQPEFLFQQVIKCKVCQDCARTVTALHLLWLYLLLVVCFVLKCII